MTRASSADIKVLRHRYPYMTLTAIGERVGLTRERVRQVLGSAGLPTIGVKPPVYADIPCSYCGAIVHRQISDIQYGLRRGDLGRVFCNRVCLGKAPRRTRESKFDGHWAYDLHQQGKTYAEIGRLLGCSLVTAWKMVKAYTATHSTQAPAASL